MPRTRNWRGTASLRKIRRPACFRSAPRNPGARSSEACRKGRMRIELMASVVAGALLTACAPTPPPRAAPIRINEDPYPSTYVRYPGVPTVIRNATVFDGEGGRIEGGTVVFAEGLVQAVGGPELAAPA